MSAKAGSFDPAPLLAQLEREIVDRPPRAPSSPHSNAVAAMVDALGGAVSIRTVHRWRRGARLNHVTADKCAIALRLHPLLLWPDFHR